MGVSVTWWEVRLEFTRPSESRANQYQTERRGGIIVVLPGVRQRSDAEYKPIDW